MQIKPVTKANKPEYPAATEIDIPKVLNASKPKKWKRNAAIGAVLLGMALHLNSCINLNTDKNESNNLYVATPLFEHGRGLGSTGCMVVAPPIYLTEAEATQVIKKGLENAGLNFVDNADSSLGILVAENRFIDEFRPFNYKIEKKTDDTIVNKHITVEGIIANTKIKIVFVSNIKAKPTFKPYTVGSGKNAMDVIGVLGDGSSVQSLDVKKFAKSLIDSVASKEGYVFFYDPVTYGEFTGNERNDEQLRNNKVEQAKAVSKNSLRAQVRDFLAWYKENKGKK